MREASNQVEYDHYLDADPCCVCGVTLCLMSVHCALTCQSSAVSSVASVKETVFVVSFYGLCHGLLMGNDTYM